MNLYFPEKRIFHKAMIIYIATVPIAVDTNILSSTNIAMLRDMKRDERIDINIDSKFKRSCNCKSDSKMNSDKTPTDISWDTVETSNLSTIFIDK